jgi:hypothetical protein
MNNVVHVSEMCPSMVAEVDVGEGMAKTLLRRKHVACPTDTISPAEVECLLRLRGVSFEQILSESCSCDLAEPHSRRAKVRSCKAQILGTTLDQLRGIVHLVLDDGRFSKNNIFYMCRAGEMSAALSIRNYNHNSLVRANPLLLRSFFRAFVKQQVGVMRQN